MNQKWIELALKYGGFMEQDRIFLENRLANLTDDMDKKVLVTPPASVLNAYFAELYQKRSPKDATDYFFNLSKDLELFQEKPDFRLEGKAGAENFRFIRLNLSGKSFGFCYKNAQEEALIFSEFPLKITRELVFELSQIFPHYVLVYDENEIGMKKAEFGGAFEAVDSLSALTDLAENANYMRLSSYNIDDLFEQAEKIGYFEAPSLQFYQKQFNLYIKKLF
ncbi:MAG: hypothetical protein ACI31W_02660 [Lactococcus sp.]